MEMPMTTQILLRLSDGSTVTVRAVTPDDKPLLVAGFDALSERARYLRFMTPTPALSRSQLTYLSEVDHDHHIALGVLDGETPVAIARMVTYSDSQTDADVAVAVVDAHQRRGIGTALIRLLGAMARHRGIERLHFDVLAENSAMLGLLAHLGASDLVDEDSIAHCVIGVSGLPAPETEGSVETMVDAARVQAKSASSRSTKTA